jgi:hypothetical protein
VFPAFIAGLAVYFSRKLATSGLQKPEALANRWPQTQSMTSSVVFGVAMRAYDERGVSFSKDW